MKPKKFYIIIFCFLLVLTLSSWQSNKQFRTEQAFITYGNTIKSILNYYINEVPIDTLLKNSIDGMLISLDPYSKYMHSEELDEIEIIKNGEYKGLGFSTINIDSLLTVIKIIQNSPAHIAGLHIGDIIYKINDKIITDSTNLEVKIKASDKISLVVLRKKFKIFNRVDSIKIDSIDIFNETKNYNIVQDTLKINIVKNVIKIPSISHSTLLDNNIGYIKIDFFASKCSDEFINNFYKIQTKSNNNLRGLIIDLRDNPGGMLEEAINISKFFIPQNTKLLTIKGRYKESNHEFISNYIPIDTNLPIAILINEKSASASELLAGIFQDLDRGVIIGSNSYGKGLVQSVFNISTYNMLKLTTSKFYTPSGRNIQKIDYAKIDTNLKHKEIYYTKNGRIIKNSSGIIPDINYKDTQLENIILTLKENNLFFNFSILLYETINSLKNIEYKTNYQLDNNIYNLFVLYVTNPKNIEKIDEIKNLIKIKETFPDKINNNINSLIEEIILYTENSLKTDIKIRQQAEKLLNFELNARFNDNKTLNNELFFSVNIIDLASNLFLSNSYKNILKAK